VHIDIYSDLVCPWCFIGKRRLDRVLQGPVGQDVELRWKPYQLYPQVPVAGWDRAEYLRNRYGADADPVRVPQRIASEAHEEGLQLDFAAMQRLPNTLLGHRLLAYAGTRGLQHELADLLFQYYFEQGRDVGDHDTLVAAAVAVGMPMHAAAAALADPAYVAQVEQELQQAADADVSGVPCFMLAGKFALPGVQTPEVMVQFIERAKQRLT